MRLRFHFTLAFPRSHLQLELEKCESAHSCAEDCSAGELLLTRSFNDYLRKETNRSDSKTCHRSFSLKIAEGISRYSVVSHSAPVFCHKAWKKASVFGPILQKTLRHRGFLLALNSNRPNPGFCCSSGLFSVGLSGIEARNVDDLLVA